MNNLAPRIYQIEFSLELLNNVKDILINDFQNASIIPPDTITIKDPCPFKYNIYSARLAYIE